jgi:hypothetical protein
MAVSQQAGGTGGELMISTVSPISSPLFATPTSPPAEAGEGVAETEAPADAPGGYVDDSTGEPVLTADELRALLQEPPATLPSGGE